jgi:hypothetical protein
MNPTAGFPNMSPKTTIDSLVVDPVDQNRHGDHANASSLDSDTFRNVQPITVIAESTPPPTKFSAYVLLQYRRGNRLRPS